MKTTKTPRDHYQEITDRIVTALEELAAGTRERAPWVKPWKDAGAPHNGHSGHRYQGINLLLTWMSGFADPRWYTFNQVSAHYGASHVRKGSKGTAVMFWSFSEKETTDEATGKVRKERRPFLRTYTVFNHEQIEWEAGQEPQAPESSPALESSALVEAAAAMLGKTGAIVVHGGDAAAYSPSRDLILMPRAEAFADAAAYVSTLAHEHVHWTGHASRLGRDLSGRFGSESYAAEELVAELGAAFLCADLGIGSELDAAHVGYLESWIRVLKADRYAIFTAAKLAREAAGFLRGDAGEDEAEAAA